MTQETNLPAPRPYIERGVAELNFIHLRLSQMGEPIPVDLEAALAHHGVIS